MSSFGLLRPYLLLSGSPMDRASKDVESQPRGLGKHLLVSLSRRLQLSQTSVMMMSIYSTLTPLYQSVLESFCTNCPAANSIVIVQ